MTAIGSLPAGPLLVAPRSVARSRTGVASGHCSGYVSVVDRNLTYALQLAAAFLRDEETPLQAAQGIARCPLNELPCWNDLGGADGPLSALYGADDEADQHHFLGDKVEMWHPEVRERKRADLLAAEERWRKPVSEACLALVEWAEKNSLRPS